MCNNILPKFNKDHIEYNDDYAKKLIDGIGCEFFDYFGNTKKSIDGYSGEEMHIVFNMGSSPEDDTCTIEYIYQHGIFINKVYGDFKPVNKKKLLIHEFIYYYCNPEGYYILERVVLQLL